MLSKFEKKNKRIAKGTIACRRALKSHIKDIQLLQQHMYKISETKADLLYPSDDTTEDDPLDKLWKKLEKNWDVSVPFIEQTIDKWSSRTQLLSNLSLKKKSNTVFNTTIV